MKKEKIDKVTQKDFLLKKCKVCIFVLKLNFSLSEHNSFGKIKSKWLKQINSIQTLICLGLCENH